ncbi:hypothetical protein Tco_1529969 [Tanacetum coccineum]
MNRSEEILSSCHAVQASPTLSFEELWTKVLNQESCLHRIQAAQHNEQQSAFVSQTSTAFDNHSLLLSFESSAERLKLEFEH